MQKRPFLKLIIPSLIVVIISILTMKFSPSETVIPLPLPELNSSKVNFNGGVEIMADRLETPSSIAIAEDGRIFFTLRQGTIKIIDKNGTVLDDPFADINVKNLGEAGLLGLTLHPNFTQNHLLYIYYTYSNQSGFFNKVLMLEENKNRVIDSSIILDGIPGSEFHDGGRIKFGPDGKLYVSTGDASIPELSQDLNSLAGKILRINEDGSIPQDNPFSNSLIYASGFRNVQGLAWNPENGQLYASDHGSAGNDEINLVSPGRNYGWPHEECDDVMEYTPPLYCFNPSLAPSGITFASSNSLGYKDHLIVATLKGSNLREIDLNTNNQNTILVGYGRLRDVVESKDGSIFVLTSNTDGRGLPQQNDDKILRIFKS